MIHFTYNILISLWAFTCWYIAGLGPALVLLPRHDHRKIFLLAPLIGLCLLTLIGLFQITILLVPLTPKINVSILFFLSFLICFGIYRHDFQIAWKHFRRSLSWVLFIPFILILMFAWVYHDSGFHLLVGSSDQLQYCENARQIMDNMHTGSPLDVPFARQDHFVSELISHLQPYMKAQRRGAEIMLATTTAITGLSLHEAFPVTILNALLTLGFTLVFIGRYFLHLSKPFCLILQFTFLSCFYLLLLQVQGSLAMLLGMAPGLMALAFLSRTLQKISLRELILTALIMATYISIYSEPALFNILLPTALLILTSILRPHCQSTFPVACHPEACFSPKDLPIKAQQLGGDPSAKSTPQDDSFCARNNVVIYFLVFLLTPFAVYSVIFNILANVASVISASTSIQHTLSGTFLSSWNVAAVITGIMSYYDNSAFNATLAGFFAHFPSSALIGFFILSGCGLLGYFKSKNSFAYLLAIPLMAWMVTSIITSLGQDYLRFARSLHYAIPFSLIGLILLASQHSISRLSTWIGRAVLTSFIFLNVYTTVRTSSFIINHNIKTDPILLRFDERAPQWIALQNELKISALHNAPVLISGFQETIRPFAISIIMRSQPHVLGTSILHFWPIYNVMSGVYKNTQWPFYFNDFSLFNTKLSFNQLKALEQQNNISWEIVEPKLIKRSEQAVIPVNNDFPVEWQASRDIYAPRIVRFTNICDVIYRREFSVILPSNMTSSLKKDSLGTYRLLHTSGTVIVREPMATQHSLSLIYDGEKNDVLLGIKNGYYQGKSIGYKKIQIIADVKPNETNQLKLLVKHPVKLRSISWTS